MCVCVCVSVCVSVSMCLCLCLCLCADTSVGVEGPELRAKFLEERDRAAAAEPTAEEARAVEAATGTPAEQAAREAYQQRLAAWNGRLRSFWRMNDGH